MEVFNTVLVPDVTQQPAVARIEKPKGAWDADTSREAPGLVEHDQIRLQSVETGKREPDASV